MAQPAASRPGALPRARVERYQATVVVDVSAVVWPDLATVDALARMALVARRSRCGIEVRHAGAELRELLALAGLTDVLPCAAEPDAASGVKSER